MTALDRIVTISITKDGPRLSRAGFGLPLYFCYHELGGSDVTARFSSLSEMTDYGFAVTDPAYLWAQTLLQQQNSPPQWMIGKRQTAPTVELTLTPSTPTEGDVYSLTISGTEVSVTAGAGDAVGDIIDALVIAIDALSVTGLTATDNITTLGLDFATATAGKGLVLHSWSSNLSVQVATADPGIATDYAAVKAEDNDFYYIDTDAASKAELQALATAVEADRKLLMAVTCDSDVKDGIAANLFETLKPLAYERTGMWYDGTRYDSLLGAALTTLLTITPGGETYALVPLRGVAPSKITSAEVTTIKGNNGNWYEDIGGVSGTSETGFVASGEYIDVTRFIDWVYVNVQAEIVQAQLNAKKIPYTDAGAAVIQSRVQSVLNLGVDNGGFNPGDGGEIPTPYTTVPLVASVASAFKSIRRLPDVKFFGVLAGAIHTVAIDGSISV